jgi:hypothetical protein
MRGTSAGKFWLGIAGLTGLLVAAQVLWVALPRDPGDDGGMPIPAAKPADRGAKESIGSWRKIYDPFPPLESFEVDSAEAVGASIADGESVLGVEIDGESRAYPLNMLGHPGSEIVNDTLGGKPIAVTFCGLCETPLVFPRRVDDKTLTFYVSGEIVNSNMLMRDVQTRSGWVQLLGKAVEGPLKGKRLERLPSSWTDWKTWRAGHPGTTAIRLARGTKKYSPGGPGVAASKKQKLLDALQWGLADEGRSRSWPHAGLARERVVNDSFGGRPLLITFDPDQSSPAGFDRRLDGRELTFHLKGNDLVDEATGSSWDPPTGRATRGPLEGRRLEPVAGIIAAKAIWRAFYPDGEAWEPAGTTTP